MSVIAYRADVDGLRALAVLPVVFFHLGWSVFSGGFVGVDVFFVISGYLITSIIYREQQKNTFTMRDFWWRRARRILPAMAVMVLFTVIAGWFLLAPDDYRDLARSLRYQAFFSANIFFLKQTGYFAPVAELQPLLHMWSLAVEEQFYIVYPLLLLLISRYAAAWRLPILLFITAASLVFSSWNVYQKPEETFFLLHTRAWELLFGALLVFLPTGHTVPQTVRHWVSVLGLVAILYAVFTYQQHMHFPGFAALLPVGGAALIIWAGEKSWVNRVLATAPLVFIGVMSYSLYLWHWPIIVFTRYWMAEEYGLSHQILLLLASFVLAWLSLKWVETPFRSKTFLVGKRQVLYASITLVLVLVASGELIKKQEGFPSRLSDYNRVYLDYPEFSPIQKKCSYLTAEQIKQDRLCHLGRNGPPVDVMVWGDSHASALLSVIDVIAEQQQINVFYATFTACPPLMGVEGSVTGCLGFNDAMLEAVERHRIAHVLLSSRWSVYLLGHEDGNNKVLIPTPVGITRQDYFYQRLEYLVQRLQQQGTTVWFFEQAPVHLNNVPVMLTKARMLGQDTDRIGRSLEAHQARQKVVTDVFARLEQRYDNVRRIDPTPYLCSRNDWCRIGEGDEPWYVDNNHLSMAGVLKVKPAFDAMIQEIKTQHQHGYADKDAD